MVRSLASWALFSRHHSTSGFRLSLCSFLGIDLKNQSLFLFYYCIDVFGYLSNEVKCKAMKAWIWRDITALLFALCIGLTSYGYDGEKKVTVAVAANVQYAMQAIKTKFENETGIKVEVILGSSGKLTQQIQEGAPFDVFVSADTKYPLTLYHNKMTNGSPKIYATGVLVLWSAKPGIKPLSDLAFLLGDNIKKIALANPKTAPYGVAAEEAMHYYNLYEKVQSKLVYGESIAQTNQFISTQSADVGFTAKSVVLADEAKGKGAWIEIDKKAYSPIEQAAVILKHGAETNKELSEQFYNFLFSKSAKDIFARFGYILN